jgi:phosphohistidine phosphatase
MPTLILMRHANAEPGNATLKDFDRPLSFNGWAEAKVSTNLLKLVAFKIGNVFCSSARRTRETLEAFREIIPIDENSIAFAPSLYSGDVSAYQNLLNTAGDEAAVLMIGHNPMVERLAFQRAKTGDKATLNHLKFGFPTAAIAVIETGSGDLKHFFTA